MVGFSFHTHRVPKLICMTRSSKHWLALNGMTHLGCLLGALKLTSVSMQFQFVVPEEERHPSTGGGVGRGQMRVFLANCKVTWMWNVQFTCCSGSVVYNFQRNKNKQKLIISVRSHTEDNRHLNLLSLVSLYVDNSKCKSRKYAYVHCWRLGGWTLSSVPCRNNKKCIQVAFGEKPFCEL